MDKSSNEKEYRDWKEYYEVIVPGQIQTMWNFMLYKEFTNDEIKKLKRKIRFLEDEKNEWKEKYENDIEVFEKNITNKKRKRLDPTEDADMIWYNEEIKRPKKYIKLSNQYYESTLKEIFSTLRSISDIIGLSSHPKRFDLFKNTKFNKLYRLIPSLKRLDNVIGMKEVKEEVFKMICYFVHSLQTKDELYHIVITGKSGIGKTTLAKILGSIYRQIGFLSNNTFITAKRSDLIGKYCGHTAIKTQEVIDSAEGGVLFIDEVYSLGNPEKKDSFTKECIDTINQNLTEKANNLLVIIAGYEKDVDKCFFNYNEGLKRRFPLRFNIKPYTASELYQILKLKIIEDGWSVESKFNENFISKYYDYFKYMGGDMVNLLKYAKENYAVRLMKTEITTHSNIKLLKLCDFEKAINKFESPTIENKDIILSMYI